VTSQDAISLVIGALTALGASTVFILALFLGFCIVLGFPKLRSTVGGKSMVTRSLDERVGQEAFARYMLPSAPRGTMDVLRTPELLERAKKAV
jgi:hypothetical protein